MSTPANVMRRAAWLLGLAVGCSPKHQPLPPPAQGDAGAGGLGGLGGTSGGVCSVVEHVEVPLELFGEALDPPSIARWGKRFALLGSGSLSQARAADIAVVSWDGVDVQQHLALTGLCPDDVCTNVFGVAVLATAAGRPQFLLADVGPAVSMPTYPLHARAWDEAQGGPLEAPLFDAHITAITTRVDMKSSRDGARALFVLGNIDAPEVQAIELGPDAAVIAPVRTLSLSSASWDCLSVVPTREAGAISAVARTESGAAVVWHLLELDADANPVLDTSVTVPVGDALGYVDCPTVVEGAEGYAAQWLSSDAGSLVASVRRGAESGAAPEWVHFDVNPGLLAAVVDTELFFQGFVDDEHRGFLRFDPDGTTGGPPITLPVLPESTLDHRRALPRVLSVEGDSLSVSYELETTRIFEELRCRSPSGRN